MVGPRLATASPRRDFPLVFFVPSSASRYTSDPTPKMFCDVLCSTVEVPALEKAFRWRPCNARLPHCHKDMLSANRVLDVGSKYARLLAAGSPGLVRSQLFCDEVVHPGIVHVPPNLAIVYRLIVIVFILAPPRKDIHSCFLSPLPISYTKRISGRAL